MLLNALIDAGYVVGPMIIDAQYFVPQSRPRLFIVAIHHSVELIASVTLLRGGSTDFTSL